jgi:hypothetical protein
VIVVEAVDMPTAPLRTAVSATVELSHRDPAGKQSPGHMAIESTIGAEPVYRDQDQPGRGARAKVFNVKSDTSREEALHMGGLTYGVHGHRIP